MNKKRKYVSFYNDKEDMSILDYVESQEIGFSPYIKLLIKCDMNGQVSKYAYDTNKTEKQQEEKKFIDSIVLNSTLFYH